MRVTVRNLGRLREAGVELDRDLLIFTGPNATARTYLLHALHGFAQEALPSGARALDEAFEGLFSGKGASPESFTLEVEEFLARRLPRLLEAQGRLWRGALGDVLGCGEEFVASSEVKLELGAAHLARLRGALMALEVTRVSPERGVVEHKKAGGTAWSFERLPGPLAVKGAGGTSLLQLPPPLLLAHVWTRLVEVLPGLLWDVPGQAHLLTAERAALPLMGRELARHRARWVEEALALRPDAPGAEATTAVLAQMLGPRTRRHPRALREGIRQSNELARSRGRTSPLAPLANQLEFGLLGGSLRLDEEGELTFQPIRSEERLGLHLVPASVRAVAGLAFFLRYQAERGQWLLVDEPELHLSADKQRRMARVLARVARSGIKVVVSTQSEYVLRELHHLVMLSADADGSVRQRLGYDEQETLPPARVGAWSFDSERAHALEVSAAGVQGVGPDREQQALQTVAQELQALRSKPGA